MRYPFILFVVLLLIMIISISVTVPPFTSVLQLRIEHFYFALTAALTLIDIALIQAYIRVCYW